MRKNAYTKVVMIIPPLFSFPFKYYYPSAFLNGRIKCKTSEILEQYIYINFIK